MKTHFADRITDVPRSFIREILKVAVDKDIISFAGGLPNPDLFPAKELNIATQRVFEKDGSDALQYSNSEGHAGLRQYISDNYMAKGLDIPADHILITTGSQQGLDLLSKTFLNEKDEIIIEEPGYLGAIQAFSVYRATFLPVLLHHYGLDIEILEQTMKRHSPKLIYTVPNFQNPSGISYNEQNRQVVAQILRGKDIYLIEDDPYGDLRFEGKPATSFKSLIPEQTILLGTFSKTVVPSFRIGWVVAPPEIMDKLIVAKQASDLHTNYFSQCVLYRYLTEFDSSVHISKICDVYGRQKNAMLAAIEKYFPAEVEITKPEGGMFLWATLPQGMSSLDLFNLSVKRNVVFVPGNPFYTNLKGDVRTMRLNFSCVNEETIEKGVKLLGDAIQELIRNKWKLEK